MIKVEAKEGKFTASKLWSAPEVGSHVQNPILWKNCIYLNNNPNNSGGDLLCLDLNGKVKWKHGGFDKGAILLADGLIYALGGTDGVLRLVEASPDGYKELAKAKELEAKPIWAPMALSDGKLVLRDQKQMKCLEMGGK